MLCITKKRQVPIRLTRDLVLSLILGAAVPMIVYSVIGCFQCVHIPPINSDCL